MDSKTQTCLCFSQDAVIMAAADINDAGLSQLVACQTVELTATGKDPIKRLADLIHAQGQADCHLILNPKDYNIALLNQVHGRAEQQRALLKWQLAEDRHLEIDEFLFDFFTLTYNHHKQVYGISAQANSINHYLNRLKRHKIQIQAISAYDVILQGFAPMVGIKDPGLLIRLGSQDSRAAFVSSEGLISFHPLPNIPSDIKVKALAELLKHVKTDLQNIIGNFQKNQQHFEFNTWLDCQNKHQKKIIDAVHKDLPGNVYYIDPAEILPSGFLKKAQNAEHILPIIAGAHYYACQ